MNKILIQLILNANALNFYGEPAVNASRTVKDLKYLPCNVATKYYREINEFFDKIEKDVEYYKKEEKINELEEELRKLKNDE